MDSVRMWAATLLLLGGLVLGIPQLYDALTFGGAPWVQIVMGWVSVVVALIMFFRK